MAGSIDFFQIFVRLLDNKTLTLNLPIQSPITGEFIKQQIQSLAEIPSQFQKLTLNGRFVHDQTVVSPKLNLSTIQLNFSLLGGRSVEDRKLICDGEPLEDEKQLDDICKVPDDGEPDLQTKVPDAYFILEALSVNKKVEIPSPILDLVGSTLSGLNGGHDPIRSSEGSGGAYLMRDSKGFVSVFKPIDEEPKPIDEEPNAVNNPKRRPLSLDGEGLKRGTRVGEGAVREVAAYVLDHPKSGKRSISGEENGFAGVPPTVLVRSTMHRVFNNPTGLSSKIGSLQKYVKNDGNCGDIGWGVFDVKEVHKISVLDMRLANADRHGGNILWTKYAEDGPIILIPIDHGYCLPESFEDCTFEWLYWPQAKKPYASEIIDYIKSLDAEADIALLKLYGLDLSLKSADVFCISTMLLKKGVEKGLITPFAIGKLMCRETEDQESVIEEIVQEATDSVLPESFLGAVSVIMDRRLNELAI